MTRFVFLADTHVGARPMGYQQQPGHPARLPELLNALRERIAAEGGADFVLHGGDLTDAATEENIGAAAAAFAALGVPVRLCLGNHDLTAPDAAELWRKNAPEFFAGGRPEYTILTPDIAVHVAPNHWCEQPYFWKDRQREHFSEDQLAWLRSELRRRPDLPHTLVAHSPVFGLPPEQTGLDAPLHAPGVEFAETVFALADEFPQLRLVLGAHNHMNSRVERRGVQYVTVSSFVETPFEVKWIEVSSARLAMRTLRLGTTESPGEYRPDHAYAQGRDQDRTLETRLP